MARPSFQPTAATLERVATAAGAGMSHEEIALGLGVTRKTLAKHFRRELSMGACRKRIEIIDAMYRAAMRGNVAAQKAYLALEPRASAPAASPPSGGQEKLGKKGQANLDAGTAAAGTEWESLLDASRGLSDLGSLVP
jgi:hypothetical protein